MHKDPETQVQYIYSIDPDPDPDRMSCLSNNKIQVADQDPKIGGGAKFICPKFCQSYNFFFF